MEPRSRMLTPCLIDSGTLLEPRDMVRALETVETLDYTYAVDGRALSEGRVSLVKIMADTDSATLLVNGCLFLNVSSFTHLDFEPAEDGLTRFTLHREGMTLTIVPVDEPDHRSADRSVMRLMEDAAFGAQSFVALDDDDDDD